MSFIKSLFQKADPINLYKKDLMNYSQINEEEYFSIKNLNNLSFSVDTLLFQYQREKLKEFQKIIINLKIQISKEVIEDSLKQQFMKYLNNEINIFKLDNIIVEIYLILKHILYDKNQDMNAFKELIQRIRISISFNKKNFEDIMEFSKFKKNLFKIDMDDLKYESILDISTDFVNELERHYFKLN